MNHTCHAHGCSVDVPPRMFMCRRHWYALARRLRAAIWQEYRPGQEIDKSPSVRYLAVQRYAVGSLLFKPHDEQAAAAAAPYLLQSHLYRCEAIRSGVGDPLPWLALPSEKRLRVRSAALSSRT
jgi:hypothetical protein